MECNSALRLIDSSHSIEVLRDAVERTYQQVEFYRRKSPAKLDIKNIRDFGKLPFTTKEDVKSAFPYGMLAVPLDRIVAYYESSGSTSVALANSQSTRSPSYLTKDDLDRDIQRRLMNALEINEHDRILNALPYAYTSCGLAFHRAYQECGAMIIAANNNSTVTDFIKQQNISLYLKPTVLLSAYPFVYTLLDPKLNFESFSDIKAIVMCGIATSRNGKAKISANFNNAKVIDVYGLSEFGAVTMACSNGKMHVIERDFYLEMINPNTAAALPPCEVQSGEIVITTLTRQGSPKIRYRTGDYGRLTFKPCGCGCEWPTLELIGRVCDRVYLQGKYIFPTDIEQVICSISESTGIFKTEIDANGLKVTVETYDIGDAIKAVIQRKLTNKLHQALSIDANVICCNRGDLHRSRLKGSERLSFKTIKNFTHI